MTRHRRGLQAGLTPEEAAVKAIDTSGRAVLFAGSTVCIALLGILVLGVSFLNGLAVASALTVVFTVLAAVTLLPALLGVFGMRVLSRRQRRGVRGAISGQPREAPRLRWGAAERRGGLEERPAWPGRSERWGVWGAISGQPREAPRLRWGAAERRGA